MMLPQLGATILDLTKSYELQNGSDQIFVFHFGSDGTPVGVQ